VTGEYPPFSGETLLNRGLATEIIETAFKELGWPYEIEFKPWERGYQETEEGLYFATFPYEPSGGRENFTFSQPLYPVNYKFFVTADSP
jgi:polar amino acid transport system substrate-binding protein